MKTHDAVLGNDDKETVDRAIAVPEHLTAPDGRIFLLIGWRPSVAVDEIVTAEATLQIMIPKEPR